MLGGDGEPATGAACLSLVVGVGSHACQQINHARNAIKIQENNTKQTERSNIQQSSSSSKHSDTHTHT